AEPAEPASGAPRPARRTRSAADGSASQAAPPAEAGPDTAAPESEAPRPARRNRSASDGSVSQAPAPEPEAPRRPAPRSPDAPWHNPKPAFDEPEPGPAPEAEPRPQPEATPEARPEAGPGTDHDTTGGDA
ncbi:dehydrogenase, partial [Streptomyces katrae]